ncbi:MAG: serine hydrolase domain-containing protein [Candidatus Falkowbacteria bacterium]
MDKQIISSLKNAINNGMSPGCSLVVLKNGEEKINFSYGCFSNQDKIKITSSTIFDVASVTKLYTTAVILRLQESGKINIDDRVAKYLSAFSKSKLTVLDLLTHRANFGIMLSEYRGKYQERFGEEIFNIKPPTQASLEVHYENITFLFLGRIAEIICKKFLKEIFFDFFNEFGLKDTNLGLKNQKTFISPPTEIKENEIVKNLTHDESARFMGGIAGNAGIFASAYDLASFGNLWLDGKIVPKKYIEKIFTDYSKAGYRPQGLGWHQDLYGYSTKNQKVYLHQGYTGCLLAVHLPSDTICAFNCNRTYYGRDNIKHRKIMKQLIDFISL